MKGRKLNEVEKSGIRSWLKLANAERPAHCPLVSCDFCLSWFPNKDRHCPCAHHTVKYVTKRAKEMLESK